jgi:hypothetical protein
MHKLSLPILVNSGKTMGTNIGYETNPNNQIFLDSEN